ncbi:MAG: hypothetical protein R3C59_11560 [Planctomycetaceae bacterium]
MRTICFCLSAALLVPSTALADDDAKSAAPAKVEDVRLKDLILKVPSTWTAAKSTSTMRLATYDIPAAKGDAETAELTIFNFGDGGGDVSSNITRWIGQFGSEGRTSSVLKGKAGDNEYYLADITGSYNKSVGPPFLQKTEKKDGYRMLGVILKLEGKGVYFLKLAGPDATVKAAADDFRASFGGSEKSETAYEL